MFRIDRWSVFYRLKQQQFSTGLYRIPVYSGFGLDWFPVYSGFGLDRFQGYSGFGLDMFPVYSGFSFDRFHCNITIQSQAGHVCMVFGF